VNIFTTSGALPHENKKEYAEAKYNSGIVIAREIYRSFMPYSRAKRAEMVQILHRRHYLSQ
jgi:hypothetical protein